MKKISTIAISLAIFLLVELASGKPIDHTEKPNLHDVIAKPVAAVFDHEIGFTGPNYADLNTPDFTGTIAPDDEKTIGNSNPDKSSQSIPRPITEEKKIIASKPGSKEPSHSSTSLETPGSAVKPGSSVKDPKPDSGRVGSSITTLAPVSGGGDTSSLVTSLDHGYGESDNFMTTFEPGSFSSTPDKVSYGESGGTLSTTLEASDSKRRGNSATTSIPEAHDPRNNLANVPVPATGEHRNGASDIGSSCMMVLLGIVFIAGSQVT